MQIDVNVLIGLVSALFGMAIGYWNYKRVNTKDVADSASGNGELKADIRYIRSGVEDIRIDMKAQEKRHGELSEKVARIEESVKSAHHRIDEIKK